MVIRGTGFADPYNPRMLRPGPAAPVWTTIVCRLVSGLVAVWLAGAAAAARLDAAPPGPACSAAQGQLFINQGRYRNAIREFTCVIDAQPTAVEGYRRRIEAELLSGLYSDAVRDYTRVTALVLPLHPDAEGTILDGYAARLAIAPRSVPALTGASFARWWFFDYPAAIHLLDQLLEVRANDVY